MKQFSKSWVITRAKKLYGSNPTVCTCTLEFLVNGMSRGVAPPAIGQRRGACCGLSAFGKHDLPHFHHIQYPELHHHCSRQSLKDYFPLMKRHQLWTRHLSLLAEYISNSLSLLSNKFPSFPESFLICSKACSALYIDSFEDFFGNAWTHLTFSHHLTKKGNSEAPDKPH